MLGIVSISAVPVNERCNLCGNVEHGAIMCRLPEFMGENPIPEIDHWVPKVKEVITSCPAIPVEKANAGPAPVIPKEEKSISDANSFDLVVGIGSSSEVTGIIDTGAAVNLMTFETYGSST